MCGGRSVSTSVHHVNLAEVCAYAMLNGCVLLRIVAEYGIDIWDAGAVSPPASEFVWSNGRICNSVANRVGVESGTTETRHGY